MRVAIVTETYPPEINGVAMTVRTLERGLRARGHSVDVVRPRQAEGDVARAHETLVAGAPLPGYPGLRLGFPASGALRRAWRASPPDVLYIATEGPLGWAALRVARAMRIPAASGLHTRFDRYMHEYGVPRLGAWALRWMRHFHNRTDATLVPTRELAAFLRERGFRNVVRLPRAVDATLFDPARRDSGLRERWGVSATALAVIHFGRVAAEKNLDLVVRAFEAIRAQRPDARLVWIGDGPALGDLQRARPDDVFCGTQRGEALARHVATGDLFLFLFPSRSETFGNVTVEAMASGVPTVAFDTGAAREFLRDRVHGAAVRDGDADAFIAASVRIALDDVARRAMGLAARQAVGHLRIDQVAADLDAVLTGLVETARRRHVPIPVPSLAARGQQELP